MIAIINFPKLNRIAVDDFRCVRLFKIDHIDFAPPLEESFDIKLNAVQHRHSKFEFCQSH